MLVGKALPFICGCLGGYYPRYVLCQRQALTRHRLAVLDPITDAIYGSGYMTERAVKYAWVLGLKERIPTEEVERRTELFWQNMKDKGYAVVSSIVA